MSEIAKNLRALADWYEQHPEVTDGPTSVDVGCIADESAKGIRRVARALGTFDKDHAGTILTLTRKFGGITLRFIFWRSAVCQKRVVKTETVTELVADPNAPKVEVTRTREVVEWDCPPLLAPEAEAA